MSISQKQIWSSKQYFGVGLTHRSMDPSMKPTGGRVDFLNLNMLRELKFHSLQYIVRGFTLLCGVPDIVYMTVFLTNWIRVVFCTNIFANPTIDVKRAPSHEVWLCKCIECYFYNSQLNYTTRSYIYAIARLERDCQFKTCVIKWIK